MPLIQADNITRKTFALVDCNSFYASCEQVFQPALKNHPVIVLSNNDGCAVAMSREAKKLGIKTGAPFFEFKHLVRLHKIKIFSSNYPLYGDLSNRVVEILSSFAADIEVYSIDECFLSLDGLKPCDNNRRFGLKIKDTIQRCLGLPVCVGIGPSKTLAKAANHLAKRNPHYNGVLDISGQPDIDALLDCIEVGDVWGVGSRYAKKLLRIGVRTARALKELPNDWVRENLGGIVGLKLVQELRGMSCIQLDGVRPGKEQIMCSRTFPRSVEKRSELEQAVSSFMTRAAEKLRMQNSKVSVIHLFLRTNRHRAEEKQYHNWASLRLPLQTAYTPELVRHAIFLLERIYRPGYRFKKAGVMLSGLIPDSETQLNLFRRPIPARCQSMMESVDRINRRWGRHTVRLASSGMRPRWAMRQEMLSPRYTTNWNELKTIRI